MPRPSGGEVDGEAGGVRGSQIAPLLGSSPMEPPSPERCAVSTSPPWGGYEARKASITHSRSSNFLPPHRPRPGPLIGFGELRHVADRASCGNWASGCGSDSPGCAASSGRMLPAQISRRAGKEALVRRQAVDHLPDWPVASSGCAMRDSRWPPKIGDGRPLPPRILVHRRTATKAEYSTAMHLPRASNCPNPPCPPSVRCLGVEMAAFVVEPCSSHGQWHADAAVI